MSENTFDYYPSHDGQSTVYYKLFTPTDTPPHAIVHICHGMTEHGGRYIAFGEYLADRGIVVCAHDHIGHGRSTTPERQGYFGEKDGIENLVEDVDALRVIMRKKYPSIPYILLGHSMGSFIVREYMQKHGDRIDGVILSGTSAGGASSKAALAVTKMIRKFKGSMYRSNLISGMMASSMTAKFKKEGPKAWLTRDEEVQKAYMKDPDCMFIFTTAGYCDLFKMMLDINRPEWFESIRPDLPVFLASGADDPVGDYGEGVKKIWEALDSHDLSMLKLKLYEDCRHEILNELCRDEVRADFYDFIENVCEGVVKSRERAQW